MEKIIITATAESIEQVKELLEAGVDRIYVGEKHYGLRLPHTFSYDDLRQIADLVHEAGREIVVAVNALMHQDMMDNIKPFLDFLAEIKTDYITVGDAGVFYVVNRDKYPFKTIYDASTMVTSSRQINFWGQKAGASEAVLAREVPSAELFAMQDILEIPAEVLVYGASVIHHSKRPLLQNYYNFTHIDDEKTISIGIEAARLLSRVDVGQTVVCRDRAVIAVEGIEGTDETLKRAGQYSDKDNILIKMSRPQQDMRVDVPVIGLNTIETAIKNGFKGIVAQAKKMIFLNQKECIELANKNNIFIVGKKI